MLVLVGLAVSQVPGVPAYELNPELVLYFFLPPLLYYAAWSELGAPAPATNLRSITLLSVGLVLATTAAVGFVAWALIPGLPLAAGFALGAIVAPPDAVAATAVGRELGLPRRMMTVLSGESLLNDATALTALRVAIAAVGGGVTLLGAGVMLVVAAVGGALIGFAIGWVLHRVRRRLEPVLENALALFVPFVAYLAGEVVHASGVVAVVVAGLTSAGPRTRRARHPAPGLGDVGGHQLRSRVPRVPAHRAAAARGAGRAARRRVQRDRHPRLVARDPRRGGGRPLRLDVPGHVPAADAVAADPGARASPPWTNPIVVSWAGMRGVVSLAAAFALAADFPKRDLLLFLTFVVVFGTLVLQGLTLPWVIHRLGVVGREAVTDRLAEANAQHRAVRAGITRLDQVLAEEATPPPDDIVDKLRTYAEHRSNGAWERIGGTNVGAETPSALYRRLRTEMIRAERDEFVRLRDRGELDDEVLRAVVRDLDLEEAQFSRYDATA